MSAFVTTVRRQWWRTYSNNTMKSTTISNAICVTWYSSQKSCSFSTNPVTTKYVRFVTSHSHPVKLKLIQRRMSAFASTVRKQWLTTSLISTLQYVRKSTKKQNAAFVTLSSNRMKNTSFTPISGSTLVGIVMIRFLRNSLISINQPAHSQEPGHSNARSVRYLWTQINKEHNTLLISTASSAKSANWFYIQILNTEGTFRLTNSRWNCAQFATNYLA